MKTSIFISLLSLCLFSLSTAAPPVPFSGKLAVDGKNFHGNARFSFSIVDGQGDEHWRHSQEQGSMIENVVLNGRYLVLLGGQGMKALPPRLFLDHDQLFLRVQVDLQDGQGIRLLEPDQRITSSPYALTAELARLAEKASVADAVSPGSITQDMLADGVFADLNRTIELSDLPAEVLQGLSRTITLNDLGLDVVAELNSTIDHSRLSVEVREDLNRTTVITREMLPQNVRDDLNRTIGVAQLSAEVNEKLNRDFTIQPGSISKSLLGQDVLSDLNRTVQRHHLSEDLRAELNRTIRLRDLAPEVISDLNDSIQYGSITLDLLSSQVRNDLNRTITKSMLAEDIKNDLNRTITLAMLPQEVRDDLNRTIGGAQLSSEVAGALKPVISGSPVSIHAHAGEGATLHVQANGGNLSYQWKKEGVSLAGATSRVLTISDLNASQHEGNYTVVVSNTFGSTTSSVAQIDVNGSLTEGLAAWWKFDETAGDVAYDSSGNGNDGNLTNGPAWSEGKIGGALSFDGTNDMVRTNLSGSYNEDFTWSAWIKTTDTQGGVLGLSGDTWEVGGASFYIYQGSPKVDVHSVGAKLGNFNLSSNTWTHYLLTVKDSGGTVDPVRIFVNGLIEIDSTLNWFTYNGQNFNLRIAHVPTHGEYYEGLIDDVRIYDRVLSTVEVKALYELGEGLEGDGGSGAVVSGEVPDGSISLSKLSNEVRADLNRTITLGDLAPEVIADLNDSIQQGSITLDLLSSQVRNDLNRTITKSMLSQEVRDDLNRTTGVAQLSSEVAGALKPVIFESPASIISVGGVGVKLAVEANGGNLSYQWKKNGLNLAGATFPVLTISDLNATQHEGNYTVVVSNIFGSTTSSVAQIDVNGSLTEGLVAWWKFDETNGTIANDSSGNGNEGNLTNGPTWTSGKIGGALSFDGADDRVKIPHTILDQKLAFTVSLWFNMKMGSDGSYHALITAANSSNANAFTFEKRPDHSIAIRDMGEISISTAKTSDFWTSTWRHVTLAKSSVGIVIYLSGEELDSKNYSTATTSVDANGLWIGPDQDSVGGGWQSGQSVKGELDDYRIYDRALSAFEVKALYELGDQPVGNAVTGSGTVINGEVGDGSVTASKLANNTITTAQLNEQILKYLKPEITLAPQAPGLIFNGQTITLHSRAEGKYLTYQWYKNGQALAGANNKRYVIEDVNGTLHDGNYTLVVSNDFGSITTQPTELLVDGTPTSHSVASISMDMIFCPPGTFTMGSPTNETGRGTDETQHLVTLSHGFYLGKYEVTQAQYQAVMNGNSAGLSADPSQFKGSNRPVEKASWEDAQIFLSQLNTIEQTAGRLPTGWKYVLPTEAQWEYACRAGSTTAYSWGNDINSSRANYNWDGAHNTGNDYKQTRDVGQYAANPWGFFDMQGNVWEWVSDWKANYFTGTQTNPEGPASGATRVLRGGSWFYEGTHLRSAKRNNHTPSSRHTTFGFRVGFQPVQTDTANPELELFGGASVTREAGQAWAEPGAAGHDARDGNLTASVTITGTVDMNTTGTYVLTYSVADAAGNTASANRTVTVVGNRSVDLNVSVAMDMLWVPAGTFTMGSPTAEVGRQADREDEHNVSLTKGFYLGKYEVTQAQYEAVMTGNTNSLSAKPSEWPNNPNRPVEKVSWEDLQVFITRLNTQQSANIPAGWAYVLPTESQWEYASRAGTTTAYSWGATIASSNANYNWDGGATDGNDFKQTRDVGQYAANPWGFFDMHGNVWEWTADWYQKAYPSGNPVVDPTGPASGSYRVHRGGSWDLEGTDLRSAKRNATPPSYRYSSIGFRVGFQKQ